MQTAIAQCFTAGKVRSPRLWLLARKQFSWGKELAVYGTALVLCVGLLFWVMRLWQANLHAPFAYHVDALSHLMMVKGTLEHGWYLSNPDLGAPGVSQMYDYPLVNSLQFGLMKLLGLGVQVLRGKVPSAVTVVNLYFLLTFPLITLSALFVFRHFRVTAPAAVLASLLFTFLPYHFFRGTVHLFLSGYYLVPLLVMAALWVYQDPFLFFQGKTKAGKPRLKLTAPRALAALLICLLVACTEAYYAFFSCFFLLVAGLGGWWHQRNPRAAFAAALLIGVIIGGLLANLAPHFLYAHQHGRNLMLARTNSAAAETFGLKLVQMVLPVPGHRWPWLANVRHLYDKQQTENENTGAALGVLATAGLVLLLFRLMFRRGVARSNLGDGLALFTGAAVFLGTIGGLGALFAVLVNPSIRAYNRIALFIAFFALFALVLLLDRLCAGWRASRRGRLAYLALCAVLLTLGILDQTTPSFVPGYRQNEQTFANDRGLVRRIESVLPPGAMVLQLPLVPFPENPPVSGMTDYEHFRAYLHSRTLRWSYGATKGREVGHWQTGLGEQPLEKLLPTAALVGFDGVWLNRLGFPDAGDQTLASLHSTLRTEPMQSADGQFVFFDMRPFCRELRKQYAPREWEWRRQTNTFPLVFSWQDDFYPVEGASPHHWLWCGSAQGELHVSNPAPFPRTVRLRMRFAILHDQRAGSLSIRGLGLAGHCQVTNQISRELAPTVTVPPGRHILRFRCDAPPVRAPGADHRTLVFRVAGLTAQEVSRDTGPPMVADCIQVYQGNP